MVLYVEDRRWLAEQLMAAADGMGVDLVWASGFDEATKMLREGRPFDMVVSDFDLADPQGRTGLDLLATVDGSMPKVLFSGSDPDVPADVTFVPKHRPGELLHLLAA